jgi:hypothetical protein
MTQEIDDTLLKRYLLGELAGEEQERIEERLLTDAEFLTQLMLLEDDLTDAYVGGELSGVERERFERHFLSAPERRQGVRFAHALKMYIEEQSAPRPAKDAVRVPAPFSRRFPVPSLMRWPHPAVGIAVLGLALLIAVGAALWLIGRVRRVDNGTEYADQMRPRPAEEQARPANGEQPAKEDAGGLPANDETAAPQNQRTQQPSAQPEQGPAKPKRPSPAGTRNATSVVMFLELMPGRVRGSGESGDVVIAPGIRQLRLSLILEDEGYENYSAELLADDGRAVWRREHLVALRGKIGPYVDVTIPASQLTNGDYRVMISGAVPGREFERVGTYYLRVRRN